MRKGHPEELEAESRGRSDNGSRAFRKLLRASIWGAKEEEGQVWGCQIVQRSQATVFFPFHFFYFGLQKSCTNSIDGLQLHSEPTPEQHVRSLPIWSQSPSSLPPTLQPSSFQLQHTPPVVCI